jgi:hypothetical protein
MSLEDYFATGPVTEVDDDLLAWLTEAYVTSPD